MFFLFVTSVVCLARVVLFAFKKNIEFLKNFSLRRRCAFQIASHRTHKALVHKSQIHKIKFRKTITGMLDRVVKVNIHVLCGYMFSIIFLSIAADVPTKL